MLTILVFIVTIWEYPTDFTEQAAWIQVFVGYWIIVDWLLRNIELNALSRAAMD